MAVIGSVFFGYTFVTYYLVFSTVPGRFGPESFRPWVVLAKFGGSFRPDFFLIPLGKVG